MAGADQSPVRRLSAISLLIVINNLDSGGAEQQLLAILPALKQRGLEPCVYTLLNRGALAGRLEAQGVPVLAPADRGWSARLPGILARPLQLIRSAVGLRHLLRARRPAIVHFFLPAAYIVGGLTSLTLKLPIRVMSRRSLNRYQRRFPVLARIEHGLHRRMTALIGNSTAILAELRAEGAPPARLHLLRNGVDLGRFVAPPRAEVRAGFGFTESTLVLITLANLIPYKGHADLLDALGLIRGRLPGDWHLLCVGRDDGIGAALRQQAAALGIDRHVRWLGARDDVPALLAAADVALLCSHEEGFPNALLESMAAGLPAIATRVGGSAEAVVEGETGLLVPPGNPAALGQAILELAGDPERRAAMGRAGRGRAEREFSLARCIDDYEALYRQLMADVACAD